MTLLPEKVENVQHGLLSTVVTECVVTMPYLTIAIKCPYIEVIESNPEVVVFPHVVIVPSHNAVDEAIFIRTENAREMGSILLATLLKEHQLCVSSIRISLNICVSY